MGFDTFFGFDLIQRKTLAKLLAEAGLSAAQTAAVALVTALPTTDPGVLGEVWNDGGVLKSSAGP
jgi:hypothetical protein